MAATSERAAVQLESAPSACRATAATSPPMGAEFAEDECCRPREVVEPQQIGEVRKRAQAKLLQSRQPVEQRRELGPSSRVELVRRPNERGQRRQARATFQVELFSAVSCRATVATSGSSSRRGGASAVPSAQRAKGCQADGRAGRASLCVSLTSEDVRERKPRLSSVPRLSSCNAVGPSSDSDFRHMQPARLSVCNAKSPLNDNDVSPGTAQLELCSAVSLSSDGSELG